MTRERLYELYIAELATYSEGLKQLSRKDIRLQYETVSNLSDLDWVDIYDGVEVVGFVLITNGSHCPVNYDYHIMETYILPGKRKKGLVHRTILDYIGKHPGTYGLFILNLNIKAVAFWKRFLENKAIEKLDITKNPNVPQLCFEVGFSTK